SRSLLFGSASAADPRRGPGLPLGCPAPPRSERSACELRHASWGCTTGELAPWDGPAAGGVYHGTCLGPLAPRWNAGRAERGRMSQPNPRTRDPDTPPSTPGSVSAPYRGRHRRFLCASRGSAEGPHARRSTLHSSPGSADVAMVANPVARFDDHEV